MKRTLFLHPPNRAKPITPEKIKTLDWNKQGSSHRVKEKFATSAELWGVHLQVF